MIQILENIFSDPRLSECVVWKRQHFRVNETIVRKGEEGRSFYVVEEGRLRVTGSIELDGELLVQPEFCNLEKGDIFGETCLYKVHNRSATVTAITDGCVLEIDGKRLSIYLDDHPIEGYLFLKELFNTLIDRQGRANQRIENLFAWGLKTDGIQKHL